MNKLILETAVFTYLFALFRNLTLRGVPWWVSPYPPPLTLLSSFEFRELSWLTSAEEDGGETVSRGIDSLLFNDWK